VARFVHNVQTQKNFCTFNFGLTMRVCGSNVQMFQCTKENREKSEKGLLIPPSCFFLFFGALSINRLYICTFAHSTHFPLANQTLIECTKTFFPPSLFVHWNIYNSPNSFTSAFTHLHKPIPMRHQRMFKCTNVQIQ
jgi:hypothetical protein